MKPSIPEIMKNGDVAALARFLKDNFDLIVADAHLQSILRQAASVGGPANDPWTESTWCMWLKQAATQEPREKERYEAPARTQIDLEAALTESSTAVLSTGDFEFCEVSGWNDLVDE